MLSVDANHRSRSPSILLNDTEFEMTACTAIESSRRQERFRIASELGGSVAQIVCTATVMGLIYGLFQALGFSLGF